MASIQPNEWLERLQRGDNAAFEHLYRTQYKSAAAFVRDNSGSAQDARDVFQDALLVLFKKSRDAAFRLTADPGVYLQAVVRNLWRYRLRTRRALRETGLEENAGLPDAPADDVEILLREQDLSEKNNAVQQVLKTLKLECQQLIQLAYYNRLSAGQIAGMLGYAETFVKVKKHRCMTALREKIKLHPAFNHEK